MNALEEQIRKDINNLPKDTITNEYGYNVGEQLDIDNIVEYVVGALSKKDEETIKRCAKIVREHRLTDWSGEAEVEAEIEEIAKKIDALLSTEGKE